MYKENTENFDIKEKTMQKSRVLKNLIVSFGSKILTIALGFIVPRIVLMNYGSDVNGIINSITQIFSYMSLLEAGIALATRDMLYKPIVEKDQDGISYVASVSKAYFKKFTIGYALAVVLLAVIIPITWKSSVDKSIIFSLVFFEGMSGVLSFLFTQTESAILRADGKDYVFSGVTALKTTLGQLGKIIIISLSIRIDALQMVYCFITIVQIAIYRVYFKKHYGWINYKAAPKDAKLKNRSAYVTAEIAWVVFSSTDMVVLSTFVSTMISSVYSIYNMVFGSLTTILNTVYNSVVYLLGQTYYESLEKYAKLHDIFMSAFVGIPTILMSVCYVLIIPFIQLYTAGVSDINYIYDYVPLLFCIVQLLSYSSYVTRNLANIGGYAKECGIVAVIEAAVNLILSVVLVQWFGIYGVLLATAAALPLKVIYCAYVSDKKILKRSCKKTVAILGGNYLFFAAVVFAEQYISLNIENYFEFIIAGVLTTAVCSAAGILVNVAVNPQCVEIVKIFMKRKS